MLGLAVVLSLITIVGLLLLLTRAVRLLRVLLVAIGALRWLSIRVNAIRLMGMGDVVTVLVAASLGGLAVCVVIGVDGDSLYVVVRRFVGQLIVVRVMVMVMVERLRLHRSVIFKIVIPSAAVIAADRATDAAQPTAYSNRHKDADDHQDHPHAALMAFGDTKVTRTERNRFKNNQRVVIGVQLEL